VWQAVLILKVKKRFVHSEQIGAKYFVYYGYMKLSDMMILYVQQKQSRRPKAVE